MPARHPPPITIEVLPAGFGDSLLVSCPVGRRTWRMLIDTGPDESYPALRERLLAIRPGRDGRRRIDLFVVSHIDHDHIGGAAQLLADEELKLRIDDVWFNAPPRPRTRGVAEGQQLAELLGARGAGALPWNEAWKGEAVVTAAAAGGTVVQPAPSLPRLTVLSPTPTQLEDLYKVWARELERLRRKEREAAEEEPSERRTRSGALDLQALADKRTSNDRAVPNGSSIALLIEHGGASALLCADAFPDVLVAQLKALAAGRGLQNLAVDLVKLSHHGSRANVTQALVVAAPARHYVVSTNNAYFRHPNDEAMARVITGVQAPVLWFNHDTEHNRRWDDEALKTRHGYEVRFPEQPGQGVVVELGGEPGAR